MKYTIGFVAVILLVILTFVLIWRGFAGDRDPADAPAPLTDYTATTTVVRLTTHGRVVADQEHQVARITISRSENRLEIFEGYDLTLSESRSYPSNEEAYGTFLSAIDMMGYTEGDDDPERADHRGFCPTGQRYVYEIVDGTDAIQQFWSTSCRGNEGTFDGDDSAIRSLFAEQIPDHRELTRGVR